MEMQILISINLPDEETLNCIREIWGQDPPIFEDELPKKYRKMFNALEDIFPPDEVTVLSKTKLHLSWLLSSMWEEDIIAIGKALTSSNATNVIGYYWADDEESFFRLTNKRVSIKGWRALLKNNNIKKSYDDFEWVKQVFNLIEKQ